MAMDYDASVVTPHNVQLYLRAKGKESLLDKVATLNETTPMALLDSFISVGTEKLQAAIEKSQRLPLHTISGMAGNQPVYAEEYQSLMQHILDVMQKPELLRPLLQPLPDLHAVPTLGGKAKQLLQGLHTANEPLYVQLFEGSQQLSSAAQQLYDAVRTHNLSTPTEQLSQPFQAAALSLPPAARSLAQALTTYAQWHPALVTFGTLEDALTPFAQARAKPASPVIPLSAESLKADTLLQMMAAMQSGPSSAVPTSHANHYNFTPPALPNHFMQSKGRTATMNERVMLQTAKSLIGTTLPVLQASGSLHGTWQDLLDNLLKPANTRTRYEHYVTAELTKQGVDSQQLSRLLQDIQTGIVANPDATLAASSAIASPAPGKSGFSPGGAKP